MANGGVRPRRARGAAAATAGRRRRRRPRRAGRDARHATPRRDAAPPTAPADAHARRHRRAPCRRPSPRAPPVTTAPGTGAPPPAPARASACSSSSGASGCSSPVFLVLLAIARASRPRGSAWSARATLQRAAVTQQEADIPIPARRGSITDANGIDLAVSEPAVDIAATPYLIDDATKAAAKLAPLLGAPRTSSCASSRAATRGFVYLVRGIPAAEGGRGEKLNIAGLEFIPRYRRDYPRDWMASQLLGSVGTDGHGLGGLEYSLDAPAARQRRRAAAGQGRDGRPDRDARHEAGRARRRTCGSRSTPTSRTRPRRCSTRSAKTWQPKGATAIVMDPDDRRDPRARQLAARERQRARGVARLRAPEPRGRRHLRARLDVQGVHRRRRAGGRQGRRRTRSSTSRRCSPSPTARSTTPRTHGWETRTTQRDPRVLVEHRRGADRAARSARSRSTPGSIASGFGKPTGVDLPGEEQRASCCRSSSTRARPMGNLPIGQGIAVTPMQMAAAYAAIANGGIAAPAAHRRLGRRHGDQEAGRQARDLRGDGGVGAQDARGRPRPGRHRLAAPRSPATSSPARPARPRRRSNGEYSKDKYVASFVGFAPAKHPKLLVTVMVDEPQGEIYGGQVAAPAWRKIVNFALGYLKIGPELSFVGWPSRLAPSRQPVRPVRGRRPARRWTRRCGRRWSARAPAGRSSGCARRAWSPARPRRRRTAGARSATSRG